MFLIDFPLDLNANISKNPINDLGDYHVIMIKNLLHALENPKIAEGKREQYLGCLFSHMKNTHLHYPYFTVDDCKFANMGEISMRPIVRINQYCVRKLRNHNVWCADIDFQTMFTFAEKEWKLKISKAETDSDKAYLRNQWNEIMNMLKEHMSLRNLIMS